MDFLQLLPRFLEELDNLPNALLDLFHPLPHAVTQLVEMAGQAGLEPATTGFGVRRSSQLELLTPDLPVRL